MHYLCKDSRPLSPFLPVIQHDCVVCSPPKSSVCTQMWILTQTSPLRLPSCWSLQKERVPIHLGSHYSQVAQGVLEEKEKDTSGVSHCLCASEGHPVPLSFISSGPDVLLFCERSSFPGIEALRFLFSSPKRHALAVGSRRAWIPGSLDLVNILALLFVTYGILGTLLTLSKIQFSHL